MKNDNLSVLLSLYERNKISRGEYLDILMNMLNKAEDNNQDVEHEQNL